MFVFRTLLLFFLGSLAQGETISLTLDMSHTLDVSGLKRVAVANSKILRVRAVPPRTILLTALKVGRTMVRAWGKGGERVFTVQVLPAIRNGGVVRVSLELLEVQAAAGKQAGVKWPDALQFSGSGAMQGGATTSGLNYVVAFSSARGMIQLLLQSGWAKRLANPELYVRLGEEAVFHSGGEIPVSSTTENYGRYHRQIEWKPFGLTVKIRPQSADGLHLSSEVHVEISEVNKSSEIEGIPGLVRRKIDTKMDSQDGETVILSGLVRSLSAGSDSRTPFFSEIPLVGSALFGLKREEKEDSEVFMAMTLSFSTKNKTRETIESVRERFSQIGDTP